jgi:hypothetical protein
VTAAAGGPRSPVERILALQRQAGNAAVSRALQRRALAATAVPVVARQAATSPAPAAVTVDVGIGLAENNGQLVAAGRFMIAQLRTEMADLDDSSTAWARADEWISDVSPWLPYLESKLTEPIEATVGQYATRKIREYADIRRAVYHERVAPLRTALRDAQRQADRAAEEADGMAGQLDDAFRAAFRGGSSKTVKDVVSAVKSCISIGRNLRALAAGIGTEILKLDIPSGTKMFVNIPYYTTRPIRVEIVNVGKYTDMLTKLGKGLAVVSIALTVADRARRTTDMEQGMKDLNDAFGVGSDVATLIGAPPHLSLMSTLYIKPMLQTITVLMGQIGRQLSDENRGWVELTGELGRPNVEPGGQPMFDFMRQVMHAGSAAEMPPVTGPVREYFYEHRDKFAAGAEADLPTTGWWLWKDLDPVRAAGWVFAHRHRVWAMLYGSMPVPPPR